MSKETVLELFTLFLYGLATIAVIVGFIYLIDNAVIIVAVPFTIAIIIAVGWLVRDMVRFFSRN
jgi:hypothetical protein